MDQFFYQDDSSNDESRDVHIPPAKVPRHNLRITSVKPFEPNADDPAQLKELLKSWGVDVMYDKCIAEDLDIEALLLMNDKYKEKFLQGFTLGTQIKFDYNLTKWQDMVNSTISSGPTPSSHFVNETILPDLPNPSIPILNNLNNTTNMNNINNISTVNNVSNNKTTPEPVIYESSNQPVINHEAGKTLDVSTILSQSCSGTEILNYYAENESLNDKLRSILVEIIINYLINEKIKITTSLARDIAHKIKKQFPTESLAIYFYKERGRAPMGKLYAKYFNKIRTLQSAGLHNKRPSVKYTNDVSETDENTLNIDFEVDLKENIDIILSNNCTWPELKKQWCVTTAYRVNDIQNTISLSSILQKWTQYKDPMGYKLINIDFRTKFPNAEKTVSFSSFFENVIEILKTKIRDANAQKILDKLIESSSNNISEDGRAAGIMYLLHYILPPTSRCVKKVKGVKTFDKYTIKDSQNNFMLIGKSQEEGDEILNHRIQEKRSNHPVILLIGELLNPQYFLIYFEGAKYKIQTCLQSIDIALKIMQLFNLGYPLPSTTVWNFLQAYFYNIKNVKSHPSIAFLLENLERMNEKNQNNFK